MNYEDFQNLVPRFADRAEGGRELARKLEHYHGKGNTVVVGLPRGGVVTAAAVADALDLPLDVLVVRKLGSPGHEELAMGAIGSDGVRVLNEDVIASLRITADDIEDETRRQELELQRRQHLFRGTNEAPALAHRTVILVDDGLATGSTMEAAIGVARRCNAARVIVAVPVGAVDSCRRVQLEADELVCVENPEPFFAVGYWYREFPQIEDREVKEILDRAHAVVAA